MYYSIRHITEFTYSEAITESVMELRMQPRNDAMQRCLSFRLEIKPSARVFAYRDYLENYVHHFNIPQPHRQLLLTAESLVETHPKLEIPHTLPSESWDALDNEVEHGQFWEVLHDSIFARTSDLLLQTAAEFGFAERRDDPLTMLREINTTLYNNFDYVPMSTQVDSTIDEVLSNRRGVCQDYTHVMITLVRNLGIPCRYISGYLFHREDDKDRTAEDATHAWVQAYLPELGWVGFDPTNNLIEQERHIQVAIGRDYADVPPTKGVFKGDAATELRVGVGVYPEQKLPADEDLLPPSSWLQINTLEAQEMVAQQQQQ